MRETGIVIRRNGSRAIIRMTRGAKCDGCNICQSFGDGQLEVEAENQVDAQAGEWVDVEINPKHVVGHSILLFIFPIMALIFGYFIGASLDFTFPGTRENRGVLVALLFLFASFGIIKLYDMRYRQSHHQTATVVAVRQDFEENPKIIW